MATLMGILLSKKKFHGKNKLFLFLLMLFVGYHLGKKVNALLGGLICTLHIHLGGNYFGNTLLLRHYLTHHMTIID
jgi:hypothetical protein